MKSIVDVGLKAEYSINPSLVYGNMDSVIIVDMPTPEGVGKLMYEYSVLLKDGTVISWAIERPC